MSCLRVHGVCALPETEVSRNAHTAAVIGADERRVFVAVRPEVDGRYLDLFLIRGPRILTIP